jgi:hypothetical protein
MTNQIAESFRKEDAKAYLVPVVVDLTQRDKEIDSIFRQFWPDNVWNTVKWGEKSTDEVYQHFTSVETFANLEQSLLSTSKLSNTAFAKRVKEMWICHWIKFERQKNVRRDTIEKKRDELLKSYAEQLNKNNVRHNQWGIPPVTQLLFPASYAGMEAQGYKWNKQFNRFDPVEKLHRGE